MKVKKRWQKSLIKLKLTHLRQYLKRTHDDYTKYSPFEEPFVRRFHKTDNVIPLMNINYSCSQLKKSMRFLRECKLRNHETSLMKVFSCSTKPNVLPKSNNYNSKIISDIATIYDVVTVLTSEFSLKKHSDPKARSNTLTTSFYNLNNLFSKKHSGIFVDRTVVSFHLSILRKILG